MNKFENLGLAPHLLDAINDMGFTTPSEVQSQAIPLLLSQETDLVALAQTGTGKTAAFGFPLIQKIQDTSKQTQGLILSPTRELCLQITNELKNYAKYLPKLNVVAIYGGASITDQARQIERGAQIVVATPGRMKDMIGRKMVDISSIDYCVLDEADEMLNMGFYEDIKDILKHTPEQKKTWLFSATMPKEVATIAKEFMQTPKEITVGSKNEGSKNVSHEYYLAAGRDRYYTLKRLADANPDIFSVIFCRTKRDTQKVAEKLIEDGYNAAALHGDLSQNQRDLVMKSFRSHQIQMLVATDVAARGIDVDDVTHVINYQLPDEIETYTHRSGRTGRAGKKGISMVIITKSELRKIKAIERIIKQNFEQKNIPSGEEICEVQLFHLANSIKETSIHPEIDKFLPKLEETLQDFSKEELIKKFFSVEFTRFYNYYKNSKDLNQSASADYRSGEDTGDSIRYFINVGAKDDFTWMTLKDYLKDKLGVKDAVYKVDVKDSFSFFNTDANLADKVAEIFKEVYHQGRKISIEVTKNSENAGGRRKSSRRSESGGKKRDFKRRGNFSKSGNSKPTKDKSSRKSNIKSSINRRKRKK